jgi:hypothetical protein
MGDLVHRSKVRIVPGKPTIKQAFVDPSQNPSAPECTGASNSELVASFANQSNLLKYAEKTNVCPASTHGGYGQEMLLSRTFPSHIHHGVPHIFLTAPLSDAAGSFCATENSQSIPS